MRITFFCFALLTAAAFFQWGKATMAQQSSHVVAQADLKHEVCKIEEADATCNGSVKHRVKSFDITLDGEHSSNISCSAWICGQGYGASCQNNYCP
jgi:hypothetical protein